MEDIIERYLNPGRLYQELSPLERDRMRDLTNKAIMVDRHLKVFHLVPLLILVSGLFFACNRLGIFSEHHWLIFTLSFGAVFKFVGEMLALFDQ
jgi:hypothetical protein